MNAEDEEFALAQGILRSQTHIPRLSPDCTASEVAELLRPGPNGGLFFRGDVLYLHESMRMGAADEAGGCDLHVVSCAEHSAALGSGAKRWDASIVLGKWLYANAHLLSGRLVELGAGSSGIPGLACAVCQAPTRAVTRITLTECMDELLSCLRMNVGLNASQVPVPAHERRLEVKQLLWGQKDTYGDLAGATDVVVGAEVVWEGCDVAALVSTVRALLRPESGVAFILGPRGARGAEKALIDELQAQEMSVETLAVVPSGVLGDSHGEEDAHTDANMEDDEELVLSIIRYPTAAAEIAMLQLERVLEAPHSGAHV